LRCPFCAHDDSQVKDSRPTEDNTAIRRRRQCEGCGARFTTFERVWYMGRHDLFPIPLLNGLLQALGWIP